MGTEVAQNSTTGTKTLAAIVGPGNIGTDLLSKLRRSRSATRARWGMSSRANSPAPSPGQRVTVGVADGRLTFDAQPASLAPV